MNLILKWIINSFVIISIAYISPGIKVESFFVALVASIILGLVNLILRPILIFLTLPITLLTLGLFMLIINAFLVMLTSYVVSGFEVSNFWWALFLSLILSVVNLATHRKTKEKN